MNFSKQLINWYLQNKRDLPWRETQNPYLIWLSEIMLQQTRVAQGTPYFLSFTAAFPTVFDLAAANEEQVLKLWQGLGYYSRARNLHFTAQYIYNELNGVFPKSYAEIIKLKGIGPYTAAAIASFAHKEPVAVVDGNVFRVLARFFGIHDDIAITKTRAVFQNLANELISTKHPDLFNHAIMDFGATVCLPANPKCSICIFNENCFAFLKNEVAQLPVKNKKISVKNRYLNYLILRNNHGIVIQQRTEKDIWQQLFELPLIETSSDNEEEFFLHLSNLYPNNSIKKVTANTIKHKLSHQQLHINFYEINVSKFTSNQQTSAIQDLHNYAYPIVIWNFLKDFFTLEKI